MAQSGFWAPNPDANAFLGANSRRIVRESTSLGKVARPARSPSAWKRII